VAEGASLDRRRWRQSDRPALRRDQSGIKSRGLSPWHHYRLGRGEGDRRCRPVGLKALCLIVVIDGDAIGVCLCRRPSGID
jgi:hypothetical protein